jgi:hypothetical protein
MWCDLFNSNIGVVWEEKNIQFPYVTIEMWSYQKENIKMC